MRLGRISAVVAAFAALIAAAPPSGVPAVPQPAAPQPAAATTPPVAGTAAHPLEAADVSAWLDGMLPLALKSGSIAGGVVVVVKDGKVLFQKGYGQADIAAGKPMDAETTMVRPGSTSKLFTWTAVMQQVQAGKIDLDRDINAYLDFKIPQKFGRPVTMRDLMNHRAGFEEGLKDILTFDPAHAQTTESYLKNHPRPMLFAPGTVPAYSNYGAALAGYVVQRVSGEPFERYVENHIFRPLGMAHSTFDQPLPARFAPFVSKGYPSAAEPPQTYEQVITRPAGSLTTTAPDMARFMIAHLQQGGGILDPATAALMHSPSETNLPGFAVMAHGFFYGTQNGQVVIGHGGDTIVFHSELDLLPQRGVGIFYSFNSRGANGAVYGLRQGLLNGFLDRYFPAPAAGAFPPALASAKDDAARIAGRYESSRRVEHGFLRALYLVQQTVIGANPDGTITVPSALGDGPSTFREVGPQIWRALGGTHEVALRDVDGVKTVIDSEDPITVLQAASFVHSAPLNLTVLIGSLAILVWTLLLWPLSPILRRGDRATLGVTAAVRRLRLFQRGAAVIALVYLLAWWTLIKPVLASQLQIYQTAIDGTVRALQLSGPLVIAAAAVAVWCAVRQIRLGAPLLSRVWAVLVAMAMLGIVWIGIMGNLMSWNVNY